MASLVWEWRQSGAKLKQNDISAGLQVFRSTSSPFPSTRWISLSLFFPTNSLTRLPMSYSRSLVNVVMPSTTDDATLWVSSSTSPNSILFSTSFRDVRSRGRILCTMSNVPERFPDVAHFNLFATLLPNFTNWTIDAASPIATNASAILNEQ